MLCPLCYSPQGEEGRGRGGGGGDTKTKRGGEEGFLSGVSSLDRPTCEAWHRVGWGRGQKGER